MQRYVNALTVCLLIIMASCRENHLINNADYRSKVETVFAERRKLASNRKIELYSVFERKLSAEQNEALQFLLAYSPLNDLADYNGEFFLANADLSIKARKDTPWGRNIPEDIFLHYVLPVRVNNENLDSFRIAYYPEIMDRIKGLDVTVAALEINHWCHEKVSYQPSDIRTSSPMSTILSARGRCGEESTLTVAALRTAGIPARQVYTPRWAHSDDNHAWVEIWNDGEWFYMGACEPEPVLDRGWFTEPARRAMLIHTKSFGAYTGNENPVIISDYFTEVNNLSKYAVTKKIAIKVLDNDNLPVESAIVEYQLYNFAEFYPLAMVPTDSNGISTFETGLGDLLIWARKGDAFNFKKVTVNETDTLILKIDRIPEGTSIIDLDLGVPVQRAPIKAPDAALIAANNKRVNDENIIRQKYIDTWMNADEAGKLAADIGADPKTIRDIISGSMGNWHEISSFLRNAPDNDKQLAVTLLLSISDKDLRDTKEGVLSDHLKNSPRLNNTGCTYPDDIYKRYILNPRISNELLVSWRGILLDNMSVEFRKNAIERPSLLIDYVNEKVKIMDEENYYGTPITPRGVQELSISDSFSRDIYFVALCRTLGIPARLEAGSNTPQYYLTDKWNDVIFSDKPKPLTGKGFIRLVSDEKNPVPEYYIHFTIARFENGHYKTLEYDYNRRISNFKDELALIPGHYMVVTGNRLNDNRILSAISFFDLRENEHRKVKIELKKDFSDSENLGRIDPETIVNLHDNTKIRLDAIIKNGVVITWIDPDKEPTKHVFNDLPLLKTELDTWGGYFIFLTSQTGTEKYFNFKALTGLPDRSLFGTDSSSELLGIACGKTSLTDIRFPYTIIIDKSGTIVFRSEGYRIGIGEQILKKVK